MENLKKVIVIRYSEIFLKGKNFGFFEKKLYDLMSRNFIANTPIFENQKDMFKKRIEKIGFGDMFQKYNLNLKL